MQKEIDKQETSYHIGTGFDSDQEIIEDSEDEYNSADEADMRRSLPYDLDTMFEIIKKRDFHKWSLATIHHRYTKIVDSAGGRTQISR